MDKMTKFDYLQALEEAMQDDVPDENDSQNEAGELSEAERLAAHAEPPAIRADGKPVGSDAYKRERPLTVQQIAFAQGIVQGKTYRQAYRDAYANAKGSDASITASAYKLSKDHRIQQIVQESLEESIEHLAEDVAATKRYVLKQLITHSKTAKQEGAKLKALELMGKTVGLFIDKTEAEVKTVSAEQLKAELGQHLKLITPKDKAA
jgi:vancomycin resistance protein YoaR